MSRTSYKRNPYVIQYVYWRLKQDDKVLLKSTHINYEPTKEKAKEMCRKTIFWATQPGFEIIYVRTVKK